MRVFVVRVPRHLNRDLEHLLCKLRLFLPGFLRTVRERIKDNRRGMKVQFKVCIAFRRLDFETRCYVNTEAWFVSEMCDVGPGVNNLESCVRVAMEKIESSHDVFVQGGSGWCIRKIKSVEIVVNRYLLFMGGGGCKTALPRTLASTRSCLSLEGVPPNLCFFYAVAAGVLKKKCNPRRASQYKDFVDSLIEGLGMEVGPVGISEIKLFERNTCVSVNVYAHEKGTTFPYYITTKREKRYHVDLLLWEKHYFPIRNMSSLIGRQQKRNRRQIQICEYCLTSYSSRSRLRAHRSMCQEKRLKFVVPDEECIEFRNHAHMVPAPFLIYFDLESVCSKLEVVEDKGKKTEKQGAHVPVSVCALRVCLVDPSLSSEKPFMYTGPDCIARLFDFLLNQVSLIDRLQSRPMAMSFTERDRASFNAQKRCTLCSVPFSGDVKKCRDHCHLTGRYRSALCNRCNLSFASFKPRIYVIAHGLGNYDAHFLVREVHRLKFGEVRVVPKTSERYLSFSIGRLQFKDSCAFLAASLAALANALAEKGPSVFHHVKRYVRDEEKSRLLETKGVFPYSYLDSFARLQEERLPPKSAFYNDLAQRPITDEEYSFAQRVWDAFKCRTLRDYMEVYLLADTLILADVFENFRFNCLRWYRLDPAHYLSLAHMTFDAFLLYKSPKLHFFPHVDFYLFMDRGLRGGVSMISQRFSAANNPYMDSYDPLRPRKYIVYFDANNLYGWSMSQHLPWGNFRWMRGTELTTEFIMALPDDGDTGCFVEVCLEYPEWLHDAHRDYPLAPEHFKPSLDMVSPFAMGIARALNLDVKRKLTRKLVPTLLSKKNYVVHYRVLKFYVKMGLKITSVSRGVLFSQSAYMSPYIEANTRRRAEATNAFDKDMFKLLNNSLFGKSIERADKRSNVRLVSNKNRFEKLAGRPTFTSAKEIHESLALVNLKYAQLKLNKPSYLGCAILDLAKLKMYMFHYLFVKKMYGDRARLLMTDTDSLMYEIQTDDVYDDLRPHKAIFDFSNYDPAHVNYDCQNNKVPGKFKDETGGRVITMFAGLKSKMYAYCVDEKESKTGKGVPKSVMENTLTLSAYQNCLRKPLRLEHRFLEIRSDKHKVFTRQLKKCTLSSFDDKRYLLDSCFSLPYGHYKITGKSDG